MADLDAFLEHNVEGYLFGDLRRMQALPIGYPLLMTSFAGVELLGALLSSSPFDASRGRIYFTSFWKTYLYESLTDSGVVADVLYQLVRHGIAHAYVLEGPIAVVQGQPDAHLTRDVHGVVYVDAAQLANDLMDTFVTRVKPIASSTAGNPSRTSMTARLSEMVAKYLEQAASQPVSLRSRRLELRSALPSLTATGNDGIVSSSEPSNKGMKLTSVERIGRSQLIPGVRPTFRVWPRQPRRRAG